MIPCYEILIDFYKANGDDKKQLFYIEQLLKGEKKIRVNNKYFSKRIKNEFDIPQLLSEKQKLITQLENDVLFDRNKKFALGFIAIFCLSLSLYYYSRQKTF